jgi:uncharacterized surface protein with fasciclin (FAS1) repeats
MKLRNLLTSVLAVSTLGAFSVASAPTKDIVDTAVGAGSFKTLTKLVTDAGLVDTLKSDGPFTVFAPSDAAFAKVPKAALNRIAGNKELLKQVLLAHVVAGQAVDAKTALSLRGKSVETAGKEKIKLAGRGNTLTVGGVRVVATDVKATNGVIHVLDGVILPASVKKSLAARSHH